MIVSISFIHFDYFIDFSRLLIYRDIRYKVVDVLEILNENVYSNFCDNGNFKYSIY